MNLEKTSIKFRRAVVRWIAAAPERTTRTVETDSDLLNFAIVLEAREASVDGTTRRVSAAITHRQLVDAVDVDGMLAAEFERLTRKLREEVRA